MLKPSKLHQVNIFNNLKKELEKIILSLAKANEVEVNPKQLTAFTVEPCKDKNHGDLATNIAMVFCKSFKTNPRNLAQQIITELKNNDSSIQKIEIAGAGFINIVLTNETWQQFIGDLLQQEKYQLPQLSNGKTKINIECASPNPTGHMHVGHVRGAVYADILANLLEKTGYKIDREHYMNDAGQQMKNLIESVRLRCLEIKGEKLERFENFYPGQSIEDVAKKLYDKLKNIEDKKQFANDNYDIIRNEMVEIIKNDLERLKITVGKFISEKRDLHSKNKVEEAIETLRKKDLIEEGIIEAPKGKKGENYQTNQKQTLFKSTKFGDDMDRVVQTADGRYTYFAADIAYSLNKFERGANRLILCLGFDHAGYVKRLKAAVKAITDEKCEAKVILCQMVKFVKDGNPLKMSKRAGNYITAEDVIEKINKESGNIEAGADVMRFIMLTRKNDAPFDFDLSEVLEQSKDNPIFYVQYAHARCHSVLRNLKEQMPKLENINNQPIDEKLLENLKAEEEIEIIKKLASYPRIIEMAVENYEPHRIAFYLMELAAIFHSFWNKGSQNPELKFIIKNNPELTKARIYLVMAIIKIIQSALDIFNIKPLEEMR